MYSRSSIEPLSRELLDALRHHLPQFHAEANTKARNEFINRMKKICARLRDCIFSLKKAAHHSNQPPQEKLTIPYRKSTDGTEPDDSLLSQQVLFISWYAEYLTKELRPTSSYQRHITALKIMPILLEFDPKVGTTRGPAEIANDTETESLQTNTFTSQLLRCVLDLVLDPFDDVRQGAATVLELVPRSLLLIPSGDTDRNNMGPEPRTNWKASGPSGGGLIYTLHRAEAIMRDTGRADHADGVGRLYDLLYVACTRRLGSESLDNSGISIIVNILGHLEHDIKISRDNMRMAVGEYPLHGYLIAVR